MIYSNETQGDLMRPPFLIEVSVVQFKGQMSKLNGLEKTHRERIFVIELKLKLRSPFHHEQIV